jgi:hypothetical protein
VVLAVVAVLLLPACIGATSRDDFEQELLERGNGFAGPPPLVALDLVLAELGVADVELTTLRVDVTTGSTLLVVRDPRIPENLDAYRVERGELQGSDPMQVPSGTDLDAETFLASSLPLDRYEELLATALTTFGAEDAEAETMTVWWTSDGVLIRVEVDAPRASGAVRFDVDGRVLGVEQ